MFQLRIYVDKLSSLEAETGLVHIQSFNFTILSPASLSSDKCKICQTGANLGCQIHFERAATTRILFILLSSSIYINLYISDIKMIFSTKEK